MERSYSSRGRAGCPISRVLCEKWGFSLTPSPPLNQVLHQIFCFHGRSPGTDGDPGPGVLPSNAGIYATDEHWANVGLIVGYKSKAPLLAKDARNGAPGISHLPAIFYGARFMSKSHKYLRINNLADSGKIMKRCIPKVQRQDLRHPRLAAQSCNAERRRHDRKGKWDAPAVAERREFQNRPFISRNWIGSALG